MKYAAAVFLILLLAISAGCSGSQAAVSVPTETSTAAPEPTETNTPVPTAAPTLTLTPSPTATLESSELAAKGYDIADVRLSYPREDLMIVKFRYRLEENRQGRRTFIVLFLPKECRDNLYEAFPPRFLTRIVTGQAELKFKMTLQGACSGDTLEFAMFPDESIYPGNAFYREFVRQPYRLVRNFPTLNSDTFKIENLQFTPGPAWMGVFTFDYVVSDEIPFSLEEYRITIYAFGPDGNCLFGSGGSMLVEHVGRYRIDANLHRDLGDKFQNCLGHLDHYTYTTPYLAVDDVVAERTVYHQALTGSFRFVKKLYHPTLTPTAGPP